MLLLVALAAEATSKNQISRAVMTIARGAGRSSIELAQLNDTASLSLQHAAWFEMAAVALTFCAMCCWLLIHRENDRPSWAMLAGVMAAVLLMYLVNV
jgi:hypothetical protein